MKFIDISLQSAGVILFLSLSLFAQDTSPKKSLSTILSDDAATFITHARMIFTSPLHWEEEDFLKAHFIINGTFASFALDDPVRKFALHNQTTSSDKALTLAREYGREIYGLSLGGGLYLGGLLFKSENVRMTGMMLVESIAFSGAITTVIKSLAGRSRPFTEEGTLKFHGMEFNNEHTSLPSGHVTVAFAISSTLSGKLNNTWASIGLYSLATLTAASRIYTDDHWFSDTFLGAAIGTSVGMSVVKLHEKDAEETSLRIVPTFNGMKVIYFLRQ